MAYLKRISSPKTWVTPRKGTKYLTRPYPGKIAKLAMPLNLVLRDLLQLVSTRKEVKILLNQREVLVNGKAIKTEKFPVGILDVVSIPRIKKNYQLFVNEKKKFGFKEVKEDAIKAQVSKVIGKTTLKKKKMQLNLFNGRNILSEDAGIKVNDSVKVDINKNKILKHLPIKTGSKVYIIGGTHLGNTGVANKVTDSNVNIKIGNKSFEIKMKNVYVME